VDYSTLPPRGVRSIVVSVYVCQFVCVCVCLSVGSHIQKWHVQISPNVLYSLPAAAARCFSDGNAIYYVLPVLWMTSCFHITEGIGTNQTWRVCFGLFARCQRHSGVRRRCVVEFARRRHRGRSLPSTTASCCRQYCSVFVFREWRVLQSWYTRWLLVAFGYLRSCLLSQFRL